MKDQSKSKLELKKKPQLAPQNTDTDSPPVE
jgi:hypothetical protein